MIEGITIECDEDGFHLILEGDVTDEVENYLSGRIDARLNLRLSQTAAWSLPTAILPILEWRAEGERQRANVAAGLDHNGLPLDVDR